MVKLTVYSIIKMYKKIGEIFSFSFSYGPFGGYLFKKEKKKKVHDLRTDGASLKQGCSVYLGW